jgi:hypothetical protein
MPGLVPGMTAVRPVREEAYELAIPIASANAARTSGG